MFWKFHLDSGGIDSLLAKEDVTLKEILDKEEVLQECKAQNTKLIDFLLEDNVLKQLLHHVIDEPDEELEESIKYKYKNLSCEVLTSDLEPLLEKLASNEEYLDILWSYVGNAPPLNPLIASFFSKVLSHLVWRKSEETLNYLKSRDAVNKLIVHIDISAIVEVFINFLKYNTMEDTQTRMEISKWYDENKLIEKIIEKLHPSESEEVHYNAAQLMTELVRLGRDTISQEAGTEEDPILLTCERHETIEKLLAVMLDHTEHSNSDSSIINGISITTALLEVKRPLILIEGMEELITQKDIDRIAQGVYATLDVLSTRLKDFHEMLVKPRSISPMETTFGLLDPPLGKVRLNIAALVSKAVATNTKDINVELSKTDILKALLDLFSQFEWNNFLHMHVQELIQAILYSENIPYDEMSNEHNTEHNTEQTEKENQSENVDTTSENPPNDNIVGGNQSEDSKTSSESNKEEEEVNKEENVENKENPDDNALLKQLFEHCELIQRCLELWEDNVISEKSGKPRKGYMGHLTRIMNDIVRAKEEGPNHETIKSLFNNLNEDTQKEWQEIVINDLEETNKKNIFVPMNAFDSDDDLPEKTTLIGFEGTLQQAFENYQVQHMTNEFIETFGYDENLEDSADNISRNPFVDVGKIDLTINANNISDNEKLFNTICDQKIKAFEDDEDSDEEDIWEEKQLTFVSPPEPRQTKTLIESDSDSSGEDGDDNNTQKEKTTKDGDEKMDVDVEWTANFENFGMDVQNEDSSNWAAQTASNSSDVFATNTTENFADFTDISKFDISTDPAVSPVAMETDLTKTVGAATAYEVTMDTSDDNNRTAVSSADDSIDSRVITSSICATTDFVVIDAHVTSAVTSSGQQGKSIDVISPVLTSITVKSSVLKPTPSENIVKSPESPVKSPESPDLPMSSSETNEAPKESLFNDDSDNVPTNDYVNKDDVINKDSDKDTEKSHHLTQQNGPTGLLETENVGEMKT